MNNKYIKVAFIAFIKDNKFLVSRSIRSSLTDSWTLVGGGVEENETTVEAVLREVKEEIGNGFTLERKDLKPVLCFRDQAESDPNKNIEMTIFVSKKDISVILEPNDEIIKYAWISVHEKNRKLTNAITQHFIPYAVNEGILY